jgi:hypothetical protein
MVREHLFNAHAPADPLFRWRGGEVSRLEGLSDGVFGILALLVYRAYTLRNELQLDELECFLTISSIRAHLFTVFIALISIFVLLTSSSPGLAGITYFLMGPVHGILGYYTGSRARRIQNKICEQDEEEEKETNVS